MAGVNTWMRTQRKKLLAILCAVIMFTWVIGGALDRLFTPAPVPSGTIFGEEVSGDDIDRTRRALALLARTSQTRDAETMTALAWETHLLAREARDMGLAVSDSEVAAALRSLFSDREGRFDRRAYESTLPRFGLRPSDFEETLRDYFVGRKVMTEILWSVPLTTEEAWRWWSRQNARAKVRYAHIDARRLAPHVDEPTAEEIEEQYEVGKDLLPEDAPNGAGYLQKQKVKIEYIRVDPDAYRETVEVTDEEIAAYYEDNIDQYVLPEADEDEDADAPTESAEDGEDAIGAGETPENEAQAGKTPGDEDEAEEDTEPSYRPLEAVREEIEEELRGEKAREKAERVMAEVAREIARQRDVPFGSTAEPVADFKSIAEKLGLAYDETDWFTEDEVHDLLPGATEIRRNAFQNNRAVVHEPRTGIQTDRGIVAYQVTDTELAEAAPLGEVRERVVHDVRLNKAILAAHSIAAEAAEKDTFDETVEDINARVAKMAPEQPKANAAEATEDEDEADEEEPIVMVGESNYFGRPFEHQGQYFAMERVDIGRPGGNKGVVAAEAFRLRRGEVGVSVQREGADLGAYALEMVDIMRPDKEAYLEVAERERPQILTEKREAVIETWKSDLIRRAAPSQGVRRALAALEQWPISAE